MVQYVTSDCSSVDEPFLHLIVVSLSYLRFVLCTTSKTISFRTIDGILILKVTFVFYQRERKVRTSYSIVFLNKLY